MPIATEFLLDFGANGLATMLGVFLALFLDRLNQRRIDQKEKGLEYKLWIEKRARLLVLLLEELKHNKKWLEHWENNTVDRLAETAVLSSQMKHELWNALSDGGELESIRDIAALNSLSEAYYSIRSVEYLADRYLDAIQMVGDRAAKIRAERIAWALLDAVGNARRQIVSANSDFIKSIPAEILGIMAEGK